MAFRGKQKESQKISCDFMFDGAIKSNAKGALINEFIKYLLYERQQFPLPFDHVKSETKQATERQEQNGKLPLKGQSFGKLEIKRAQKAVCGLEEMFSNIIETFEYCPEIKQVLIILGSTTISPKESYLINLPAVINPEAEGLPVKTCIKSLFRQLIMQDLLGNSNPISTTSLIVLVSAPRDSGIRWFLPKPLFKPMARGVHYELNLECKHTNFHGHNLSSDEFEIEISGIEPLESSDMDVSMRDLRTTSSDISVDRMLEDLLCDEDVTTPKLQKLECSEEKTVEESKDWEEDSVQDVADEGIFLHVDQDFIWFQAPLSIQGFKDKSSKLASHADMML